MLTEEEIKKTDHSLPLSFSFSVSMPCLIHVYVLSNDMKYKEKNIHYTKHVDACMHTYKTSPKFGGIVLGGNDIGGETTRVWGQNDQGCK